MDKTLTELCEDMLSDKTSIEDKLTFIKSYVLAELENGNDEPKKVFLKNIIYDAEKKYIKDKNISQDDLQKHLMILNFEKEIIETKIKAFKEDLN